MKTLSLLPALVTTKRIHFTDSGCWEWKGTLSSEGYGQIMVAGKMHYMHRLTYQIFIGPIHHKKEVDHLCRNRKCCNPSHLEVVTSYENSRRGNHPLFVTHRDRICKRGHDLTKEENLYYRKDGRSRCRPCMRIVQLKEWRDRKKKKHT